MKPKTAQQLVDLNRQFYQTFAASFSATRRRLQPGVTALLGRIPAGSRVLDLGCGNGEFIQALRRKNSPAYYLGLDFSPGLLADAEASTNAFSEAGDPGEVVFKAFDLSNPDWSDVYQNGPFDLAVAFAVLHHLPGTQTRAHVVSQTRTALAAGGLFIHSNWQFLNSARLRARIQPWATAGLPPEEVDPGDYLLDWRAAGFGLRYVHHFDADELERLAETNRFRVLETFFSDGEGGRLSLYQVWQAV